MEPIAVFWFRRDLRIADNAGLYHALKSGYKVLPVFIFDKIILDPLPKADARVQFIYETLKNLAAELKTWGSSLLIGYDKPLDFWQKLIGQYHIAAVYTNHDYEPYARERDAAVQNLLQAKGIAFYTYKDQVIFEKDEVLNLQNKPYTVFTPYKKRFLEKLNAFYLSSYPTDKYAQNFLAVNEPFSFPTLSELGFEPLACTFPSKEPPMDIIQRYDTQRDFPGVRGVTRLGVHLRFGTISIRALARLAQANNATFLNELIWRDFYAMILWQFPTVASRAFKPEYDAIPWRNVMQDFVHWQNGTTGYPLVDAGMRELNATGYMHNRVRMVVASFLTKHLLIDWRWGEAYFAEKLLDFDLASNNGGWQWAAGSGCDAAPYFRIFNPTEQLKKFDPKFEYVRKWVPEFDTLQYPKPIVEHTFARNRALEVYKNALSR